MLVVETAVVGMLALVVIVTMPILAVVVALVDEDGEIGRRLRRTSPPPGTERETNASA
jgi:hypothetical protein